MKAHELRKKFLEFFEAKRHKIIPSAPLVTDDPSVLFTTAGMQQFKRFYTDPSSAPAKNVVTVQKCIRTSDIDEVGDDTHLTFFEMLGNFSFGGYWKKEAIQYAHEFITKELGLTVDYVSVFEGDDKTPADTESVDIWKSVDKGIQLKNHGRKDNFWGPTGDEGPCGPTTEIYVNGVEVWNIVFNEYYKTKDNEYKPLETKGVDTGMGLERLLVQVDGKQNVYEIDLNAQLLESIPEAPVRAKRIILDHFKASVFLINDGVIPSNKEQGYILRRLLRRAFVYAKSNNFPPDGPKDLVNSIIELYSDAYPELNEKRTQILDVIYEERKKFGKTIEAGIKILESKEKLSGKEAFDLFQTYGFPIELTKDLKPITDLESFEAEFKKHQELSRTASAGQFKGGLVDHSEKVVRLHTATHLMNAALKKVLGPEVMQKGSNITEDRSRFDFVHKAKMTDEEKQQVEKLVNDWISADLAVRKDMMPLQQAYDEGVVGAFGEKYPDTVSVYTIYDPKTNETVSREFCGGPHVEHTGVIGKFKIAKEEAVSSGIRRIKAIIE